MFFTTIYCVFRDNDVFDKNGKDTLWIRVYYNEYEREEIDRSLKKIYTLLHSDGNEE